MKTHELKLCKRFYDAIISGDKTFEFRKNDRGFAVGDTLILRPVTDDDSRAYMPEIPSIQCEISCILDEGTIGGLNPGYCVLAIKNVHVVGKSDYFLSRSASQVYLMREYQGKIQILFGMRNGKTGKGFWDVAAGHCEKGETFIDTAHRETLEEFGVEFDDKDIVFTTIIHQLEYKEKSHNGHQYINAHFFVKKFKGTPKICEPDKCSKLEWLDIENLPENIFGDRREAIENYINKVGYSEIRYINNEQKISMIFDLEKALDEFTPFDDIEKKHVDSVKHLLETEKEPFSRETKIGHITGSVFLLSSDFKRMLMTHHKKLNKWLQFGGHSDGDKNTLRVAMRELVEESGIKNFKLVGNGIGDVDVHLIQSPSHSHYDIRFIFATDDINFVVSDESNDLKWFTLDEFKNLVQSDNHYKIHTM